MSDHTQGTMKPGVSKVFGSNAFTAVPEGNESKIVAVFGFCGAPDEAESIANAKRFCAVWNACEGIATSDLERCRDKPADLTLIALHAIRQRDELIEALKLCKTELHFWMRDHGQDIATQQAISKAIAAIANATKDAP